MKKLEDIPKKDFFEAPEGYFDTLPGIIQARVSQPAKESGWSMTIGYSLRYALPVLAIGIASFFYLNMPGAESAEDVLASIDSNNLIAYLDDSDVSTDDLIDIVPLSDEEVSAIYDNSLEEIKIDSTDVDYLSNEFGLENF